MTTQVRSKTCPVCGVELRDNAAQGLCPKCLLLGVAAPTETGPDVERRQSPPAIDALREAFPQLEIVELIGQGGMGAVFKARQPKLNRFVALKILPEAMSRQPAFAERFAREAQTLARLNHPNIVTIHDFGQAGEFFYLLMEYVEGVNLREAMSAGRFTPQQALAIVPMICEALQYAHDEGVLHRDVKPENILLDLKGRVRLVDFGIAKLAAGMDVSGLPVAHPPAESALTQSGSALGTPNYMAPEQQLSPSTVDQRADIYSLGVVFYEMLTGELPVGRFSPPSRKTPVDPRVDDVVMRAMAIQREKRFASAEAVKTSVEAITTEPTLEIPAAARGYPTPLSPTVKRILIGELAVLVLLMANEIFVAAPFTLRNIASMFNGGLVQGAAAAAGLAFVGWLAICVWRRRDWLVTPFDDRDLWSSPRFAQSSSLSNRAEDDWLRAASLAFMSVLSLQILWILLSQVKVVAQSLPAGDFLVASSVVIPTGAFLLPAAVSILLVIFLVRRELRRTDLVAPSAPPEWMPRAAILALALAVITSLPMPGGENQTAATSFGAFFAVSALPMLTRSRLWRAIALAFLLQLLFVGVTGLGIFSFLAASDQLDSSWSAQVWPVDARVVGIVMYLLSLFCYAAALAALLLPEAAAAFGIRRRSREAGPGAPSQTVS